jgi:ribonuclease-3
VSTTTETFTEIQERLGYRFANAELLSRALTHKSYANERREGASTNNERLEFLGDTVLGFVIGEMIFRSFPNLQEGALSKIKAHLVSAVTL